MRANRPSLLAALALGLPLALAGSAHAQQKIAIMPASPINLGGAPLNTPTAPTALTVSNAGNAKLSVTSLIIDPNNGNPADFAIQGAPNLPAALNAGTSFSVNLVCTPKAMGLRTGNVLIASNDPNTPTLTVGMTCTSGNPMITLDTGTAAFGNQRVGVASMPQVVTITNAGFGDLHVSKIVMGGANPNDFTLMNPALPLTVKPMANNTFSVVFKPTMLGVRNASVTISCDDPNAPTKIVNLQGTGTMANMTIDKKALDFGDARIFNASMPKTVTITNAGTDDAYVTKIAFSGMMGNYFALSLAPPMPAKVPKMSTLILNVVALPLALGPAAGTMTITTDDPNPPSFTVSLAANGVGGSEMVAPAFADYGTVAVMKPSMPVTFTVTNTGTDTLTLQDNTMVPQAPMFLDGDNPDGFMVGNMPMLPAMIAPKGTLTFTVTFTPMAAMSYKAQINLLTDDPKAKLVKIPLDGIGGTPGGAVVMPTAIDFLASNPVGSASAPRSFSINNNGGAPVSIKSIMVSGPAASEYAIDQMGPLSIDAGKSQMVNVIFTPTMSGAQPAEVDIMVDGMMNPLVVKLMGAGAIPKIGVSPGSLSFGTLGVNATSSPQTVTILADPHGQAVQITDVTSADPAFIVDKTNALTTIMPGGMATFTVTFAPTMGGMFNANITVLAGTPPTAVAMVGASGTGKIVRPGTTGCSSVASAPTQNRWGLALVLLAAAGLFIRRRRAR